MFKWIRFFIRSGMAPVTSEYVEDLKKEKESEEEIVEPLKPAKFREPVQVLIDSLEEGWWDFTTSSSVRSTFISAKHEWLQTEFQVYQLHIVPEWTISEEWLSPEEKKAVLKAFWKAESILGASRKKREINCREQEFFKLLELKENA